MNFRVKRKRIKTREERSGEYAYLCLFLIREKGRDIWKCCAGVQIIRSYNYQWGPMHISCRAARAFTLHREPNGVNGWTRTSSRHDSATFIITRRKIGRHRYNKLARWMSSANDRSSNNISTVPSSAMIMDETTIRPLTTSLIPPCFSVSFPEDEIDHTISVAKKIVAGKSVIFRGVNCRYSRYESAILRFESRYSTSNHWDIQFNSVQLIVTLSFRISLK